MAAEDLVWIIWTCEGNTFEAQLTREQAQHRLAELTLDDTVTDAHIADTTLTPEDSPMPTATVNTARATTKIYFTAQVGAKAWTDRYDLEDDELAEKIEADVRQFLEAMYVVDSELTKLDTRIKVTSKRLTISITASTKIDAWGDEYGIEPTAEVIAEDVYTYFEGWLHGMCDQFNETGHDNFLTKSKVRRA